MPFRLVLAALIVSLSAAAADSPVAQAAAKLEQQAARIDTTLAMEFRLRGAQALHSRYPELARAIVDAAVGKLASGKDAAPNATVLQALAEIAPLETKALAPKFGLAGIQIAIASLVRFDHADLALELYKTLPALPEPLSPSNAMWLLNTSALLAKVAPEAVAESYERVIRAASAVDYGNGITPPLAGAIQMGAASIKTENSRDTLLILAGSRLRAVSPEHFARHEELFAKWTIAGNAVFRPTAANPASNQPAAEFAAISKRMSTMRSLPSDADRTRLVNALIPEIRALPAQEKLGLIRNLANVATEGDLGNEALGMVAVTLADALREAPRPAGLADAYIELAKLVRYEHVTVPAAPALDTAQALLELRERLQQESGFTLTSLDGKTYSLEGLKGKIVLLNFWATWCPPCRKEMPDMEKLYRSYADKGLTVIAVSDEDRETVVDFLAKNSYTFPIALDPDRKVNLAFSVEGIPKSFIFDREGRLAAQAMDMRTESQFMELLKLAGLE